MPAAAPAPASSSTASLLPPPPPPAEDDDPLDPIAIVRVGLLERLDVQQVLFAATYLVFFVVGLALVVHYQEHDAASSDLASLLGDLLFSSGLGAVFVGVWQLLASRELAYRKQKVVGFSVAVAMTVVGAALQLGVSGDPPAAKKFVGAALLGLSLGPMVTTLLLLEPKEKETLAMPYINNFVRFVAGELRPRPFFLLVPASVSLCEHIQQRLKSYKELGKIGEHQLVAKDGFKKFSTTVRRKRLRDGSEAEFFFDIPSMLQRASPRKLQLFVVTLLAYIDKLQRKDPAALGNLVVLSLPQLTIRAVDRVLEEGAAHPERRLNRPAGRGVVPALQDCLACCRPRKPEARA